LSRLPAFLLVGALIVVNYFVFFRGEQDVVAPPEPSVTPAATTDRPDAADDAEALAKATTPPPNQVFAGELGRGDRVLDALQRLGLETTESRRVVRAMERVFEFRNARPGDHFRMEVNPAGRVEHFEFARSPLEVYVVERDGDSYAARRRNIEKKVELVGNGCVIRGNYQESLLGCLGDATVVAAVNELLAWSVDLTSDTRDGDELRIVLERVLADGQFLRYGKVLAVDYSGKLASVRLFHHEAGQEEGGYYTASGDTAARRYLRSPLKSFGPGLTARGPVRPSLHRYKRHVGVDYPVSKGTPIIAVADGKVSFAGPKGSSGTLVNVKHENAAVSYYAHLSRLAPGLRKGKKIARGDLIGFSGSSGDAARPRLHYALKIKGRFRNTLETTAEAIGKLPAAAKAAFEEAVAKMNALLEGTTPYDSSLDS